MITIAGKTVFRSLFPTKNKLISQSIVSSLKKSLNTLLTQSSSEELNVDIKSFSVKENYDAVKHLAQSVIYRKDGIVAVNKPYGIAVYGNLSAPNDIAISTLLPDLAAELKEERLFLVKSAERDCSGITILAVTEDIKNKIEKCFRRCQTQLKCNKTFWAITSGIPSPQKMRERVTLKLVDVGGGHKQPILDSRRSDFKSKGKTLEHAFVEYEVLSENHQPDCALVKISSYRTKWHTIRIYLTYKACNIIGDRNYSHQVKKILDVPIVVPPYFTDENEQVVPSIFLDKLNYSHSKDVPMFLHCREIFLPEVLRKRENIIISAPIPEHFKLAMTSLGLKE